MDAPAVHLIPPSPLPFDAPTQPPVQRKQPGRSSSDAIFSIYSMYGDDHQPRNSWASAGHDRPLSGDSYSGATVSFQQRASVASTSRLSSDLAYYTPDTELEPAPLARERSQVSRRSTRTSSHRLSAVDYDLGLQRSSMKVNGKHLPATVSLHSLKVSLDGQSMDGKSYNQFEAAGRARGDECEADVERIHSQPGIIHLHADGGKDRRRSSDAREAASDEYELYGHPGVRQLQSEDVDDIDRRRSADARDRSEVGSPRGSLATSSSFRAPSSHAAPSSSRHTPSDIIFDSAPASVVRSSDLSASSYAPSPSLTAKRRSGSPPSRRSSRSSPHLVSAADHELPPLPSSMQSYHSHSPSSTPPPQNLISRRPSPSPSSPTPVALSPKPSMKLTGKHPPPNFASPSSKISLVPSEGEDMDGFHVRNTYAQLEASGVKGDGYEEGVERTRARVGNSRTSQLQAEEALGDGQEKKRSLDPREIQLLQNVDRYGFFTIPSHDRLILLPSAPFLKKLSPVAAGSNNISPNAHSVTRLPPVSVSPKETARIAKWTRMLVPQKSAFGGNVEAWTVRPSKEAKLRERIYKGIPDRWRRAAWDLLMSRSPGVTPQMYERLAHEYREALDRPSTYDIQIDLDVPRTISGHIMFRTRYGAGQRSLFHVLHSFSLRCQSCGYVQGMGPIAATLLCYFEPERVYAGLVLLHDTYRLHDVFNAGFPGMLEAIYVQERVMQTTMPAVYEACRKHMVSTTSYATKWYITLFANSVPFQTQLRFWDVFLLEGYDVFVAIAVAIVWVYRDHLTSSTANFETILSLLSSFFVPEDENTLMGWIESMLGDKKLRANMVQWRTDWRALVASGKDGAALL